MHSCRDAYDVHAEGGGGGGGVCGAYRTAKSNAVFAAEVSSVRNDPAVDQCICPRVVDGSAHPTGSAAQAPWLQWQTTSHMTSGDIIEEMIPYSPVANDSRIPVRAGPTDIRSPSLKAALQAASGQLALHALLVSVRSPPHADTKQ